MWNPLLFFLIITAVGTIEGQKRNYSSSPCPVKCVCFRRTVRCMKLSLLEVPKTHPQTVLLDLRFNNIREIPVGTFKSHKPLRSLLLNNNFLIRLDNGLFTGLVQLRHLYLYRNRIRHIGANVFQGLPRLEHLYLQGNEIANFEPQTFSNMPSLSRLFLFHNKIKHIPLGTFDNLPSLSRLRLDQNALVCDCKMAWLAHKVSKNSLHIAANCRYPSEMLGKPIKGMTSKDFHCRPPKIMEGPNDVEVSFGSTAVFNCRVESDSNTSLVWMRDDKELSFGNDKYEILSNGSLMIKNSRESDDGHYECVAKNSDGVAKSRPARMIVIQPDTNSVAYEAPSFIERPSSVTTVEGETSVILYCRTTGSPPIGITWAFNGIQLQESPRHIFHPDGSLEIRQVQGSDYGEYTCQAANQYGRIHATANIFINVPPVFTIYPDNFDGEIGQKIRLECVAVGSPLPEITWYKDVNRIVPSQRIILSEDSTLLEINEAEESDSGLYACEARNNLGFREVSASVNIKNRSHSAPKLLFKPYNIEVLVGNTLEMPCKATGEPTPGIQWQKDGSALQRTGRWKISLSGNLYIYNVNQEDQGRYECTALNEFGRDTAAGYITVKEDPDTYTLGESGDKFIKIAFNEASQEVDKAINNTIDNLFNNKEPHVGADLFRFIRYPDAPTRELARAAEIYERTLENIRKHVSEGLTANYTTDFNYKQILSREHLELIAKLSGCLAHKQYKNCTDMCYHSRYRSIDGTCNNLQHPMWGASYTGFRRILKPIYEDGFSTPIGWNKHVKYYGFEKPPSRLVSTQLLATEKITPDEEITHMVMQWGQFLDHDLDHATPSVSSESYDGIDCKKSCDYAAPCFPIDIPPGDPRMTNRRCIDFIRSAAICGSGMTSVFFDSVQPREQINQLTSYIDASQVYGFSDELARDLRDFTNEGGRLREGTVFPGRKPLLPYAANQGVDCRRNLSESTVNCFVAGDIRVNEQSALIAMHTLWMREHNRIARELQHLNPLWDGETLYQEARKIVGAQMQHITYSAWLPYIIGNEGMAILGSYQEYNPSLEATVSNEFATAALRFGHSLINPVLERLDWNFQPIREGHLPLRNAFFSPWRIVEEGGIDPLLRGLYMTPAKLKTPDENLNTDLTEQLFRTAHAVALDLASMNVQRAREHGIPGYIEYRKFCNMSDVDTFEDLRNEIRDPLVRSKLREMYGHPGNIDIFVGGILEDQIPGSRVGPLFRCLLIEQFRRLRDGDRFYYENPSVFKPEQLVQIKQFSLSRLLCDNGDNITQVSRNIFVLPELQGKLISCENVPRVDLSLWSECCPNCRTAFLANLNSRQNVRFRREAVIGEDVSAPSVEKYRNSTMPSGGLELQTHRLEKRVSTLERTIDDLENTVKRLKRRIKKISLLGFDD